MPYVRLLTQISRGADIERKDINDMTALMWAAIEGHTSVAKVLLKAGNCQRFSTLLLFSMMVFLGRE